MVWNVGETKAFAGMRAINSEDMRANRTFDAKLDHAISRHLPDDADWRPDRGFDRQDGQAAAVAARFSVRAIEVNHLVVVAVLKPHVECTAKK